MRVQCERCSAVYELDERVLPPAGAPVQCTRCQHVFQAFPPQAPGRTLPMMPAAQADVPGPTAAPPGGPPGAPSAGARPTARFWAAPPPPAPARPASEPAAPPAAPARREGARAVPSRRGPWGWLAPLLVVLAAGAAAALWWLRPRGIDPAAEAHWREGLQVLARDDDRSLEEAARLMGKAAALDPRLFQARADRALALALLAADERERAGEAEAALRELEAGGARLVAGGDRQAEIAGRARALHDEAATARARMAQVAADASAELDAQGGSSDRSVARARAVWHAFAGDREGASRAIGEARAAGLSDPWLDLAEAANDLGGPEPARRQAVARLAALAAAHPEMLRAGVLLARAEAAMGDTGAAVASLDRVLAANPGHDLARRVKERLLAPPRAEPPSPAPGPASPPGDPRLRDPAQAGR